MKVERLHTFTGHFGAIYCLEMMDKAMGTFMSAGGDGHIVAWNEAEPDKGKVLATVEGRVFSLLYLKKSQKLVAGDMHGGLHWMNIGSGTPPIGRALHQKGVFALAADLEEQYLFSLGGAGFLGRWSIESGRATESLQLSGHSLRCYAFEAALDLAAIGASDGHIYLVKMNSLEIVQTIQNAHKPSVFSLAWTKNGRYLLSGGRDALLKIWDVEQNFKLVEQKTAHWYTINAIEFSPDGSHFATASRDKSLKVWKTEGFELKKVVAAPRFEAHINSVNRIKWLSNSVLLSASDDRQIIAWHIDY